MIILRELKEGRFGQAPTFEVRCPECSLQYVVTSWRPQITKQKHCFRCGHPRGKATRPRRVESV